MLDERLTEDTKREICAEYRNRNIHVADIRARYKLSSTQLKTIIDEAGIEPRNKGLWGSQRNGSNSPKICPKCKKTVDNKNARFCWNCGADVRSERQILIEKIDKICTFVEHIPHMCRDEYITTLNEVRKELEN